VNLLKLLALGILEILWEKPINFPTAQEADKDDYISHNFHADPIIA